jgi:hypothetical protein
MRHLEHDLAAPRHELLSKLGVAPHNRRLAAILYLDHGTQRPNAASMRDGHGCHGRGCGCRSSTDLERGSRRNPTSDVGPLTGDTTLTALQVRWRDRSQCAWSRPLYWACPRCSAQEGTQRPAHHDRRCRLCCAEQVRRRDPDAEPRPHRQLGVAQLRGTPTFWRPAKNVSQHPTTAA